LKNNQGVIFIYVILSLGKKPEGIMFEQTFKNIDGILHKNVGCGSEWDDYHHSEGGKTPR
jgi:hypothetical protein